MNSQRAEEVDTSLNVNDIADKLVDENDGSSKQLNDDDMQATAEEFKKCNEDSNRVTNENPAKMIVKQVNQSNNEGNESHHEGTQNLTLDNQGATVSADSGGQAKKKSKPKRKHNKQDQIDGEQGKKAKGIQIPRDEQPSAQGKRQEVEGNGQDIEEEEKVAVEQPTQTLELGSISFKSEEQLATEQQQLVKHHNQQNLEKTQVDKDSSKTADNLQVVVSDGTGFIRNNDSYSAIEEQNSSNQVEEQSQNVKKGTRRSTPPRVTVQSRQDQSQFSLSQIVVDDDHLRKDVSLPATLREMIGENNSEYKHRGAGTEAALAIGESHLYSKNSSDKKNLIQYELSETMRNNTAVVAPFSITNREAESGDHRILKTEESSILSPSNRIKSQASLAGDSLMMRTEEALEDHKGKKQRKQKKNTNEGSATASVNQKEAGMNINDSEANDQTEPKGYFDDSLIEKDSPDEQNASAFYSICVIFSCIVYGYFLPRRDALFGQNLYSWVVVSAYLIVEAIGKVCLLGSHMLDPEMVFQIVLFIANSLVPTTLVVYMDYLFFVRFIISLWNCKQISKRIRTITEVICASVSPNIEIVGFLCVIVLMFNLSANVYGVNYQYSDNPLTKGINSLSSLEYFLIYVVREYSPTGLEGYFSMQGSEIDEKRFYMILVATFLLLFFVKTIGESLLSVVQKISQEQCSEYTGARYSCRFLAIFKHDETMACLYHKRRLYLILQGIYIATFCYTQQHAYTNDHDNSEQSDPIQVLFKQIVRFFGLFFVAYEITIDAALASGLDIAKNLIFLFVISMPSAYPLLLIVAFFAFICELTPFKAITSMVATLIVDFVLVVVLNYLVSSAYPNVPQLLIGVIEFFITLPLLKGMLLRYSEILEIETEDDQRNLVTYQEYNSHNNDVSLKKEFDDDKYDQPFQESRRNQKKQSNSFFLFSEDNSIRTMCNSIASSSSFENISSAFFFISSVKEFLYFAQQESFEGADLSGLVSVWDTIIEPAFLWFYIIIHSISCGFAFDKSAFLRKSLRNALLLCITIALAVQPFIQDMFYLGFVRVVFLFMLPPFKQARINDILIATSKAQQFLVQIIFVATGMTTILLYFSSSQSEQQESIWFKLVNKSIYLFTVNLLVSTILVEFSKQQEAKQDQNTIWQSIQSKIINHKFTFNTLNYNSNEQTQLDSIRVLIASFLHSSHHNVIMTILVGVYYIGLFASYSIGSYMKLSFSDTRTIVVTVMSIVILFYTLLHIKLNGISQFICSTHLNKMLLFQSLGIACILLSLVLSLKSKEEAYQLQFVFQLPILLRTKYVFPLMKFGKCIIRQLLISIVSSCVFIVILAHILSNIGLSAFEYLLISFNANPISFLLDKKQIVQSIGLLIIGYLINGIANAVLLLEILRKFDMSESALAKQKYKRILNIFENVWGQYKSAHNSNLMPGKNLIFFLVKFDEQVLGDEGEEDEEAKQLRGGRNKRPKKIEYLKRIQKMGIRVDERNCLHYKDLLFHLVSVKFNQSTEKLIHEQSVSAYSSSFISNITEEDFELSQSVAADKQTVFNPITTQLYARLAFRSWKRFAQPKKAPVLTTQEDEEEDSIFLDPSMMSPESIKQPLPHFNQP